MGREREREETLLRTREDWKEREEIAKGRSLLSKIWSLSSSQKAKTVSNWSNAFSLSASVVPPGGGVDDDFDDAIFFCFRFRFLVKQSNSWVSWGGRNNGEKCGLDWGFILSDFSFFFFFFFFFFWHSIWQNILGWYLI